MKTQTVGWLIFLAIIKGFHFSKASSSIPFIHQERSLTAKEGSCIELKCKVIQDVTGSGARWFWLKNPKYSDEKRDYNGIVVYSSGQQSPPVDPFYEHRVSYKGSPTKSWEYASKQTTLCSILICNLNKSDSGNYSVRYDGGTGSRKWLTKADVALKVTDNLCPITFVKPGVVKENNTISLTCSTVSTCNSNLKIEGLAEEHVTQLPQRSISASFQATWQDDGRVISCQTLDNKDPYLIKNVTLTVEYPPRDIRATTTPTDSSMIKEGRSVTFTCSAKGQPEPTFTWSKNGGWEQSGAEWKLSSIQASDSGVYTCKAQNKHSSLSASVSINVTYAPMVQVTTSSSSYTVTQNQRITLTCKVIKSNPTPHTYKWFKNGKFKSTGKTYVIDRATHEDKGNYTCRANNGVDWGTSEQRYIAVRYTPRATRISINEKNKVRVDTSITFTCTADANPQPTRYSWYRYSEVIQVVSSQWKPLMYDRNFLTLEHVQRTDEACYMCNATNDIGTGDNSDPLCITVLYPPTKPTLTMDSLVKEGQHTTIYCSVESSPPSKLTLTRTTASNSDSQELVFTHPSTQQPNNLQYTFNVSSANRGFYTCNTNNDIGSSKSDSKEMVVKYSPKDVKVQADPSVTIDEYTQLTLCCSANSYPPTMSFTWVKTKDGKSETVGKTQTFTVRSVSPSDRGSYSCAASNEMGTGKSQEAEIKVRYAPKHTKITKGEEQLHSDGRKSLTLSCSSDGNPAPHYSWHKKTDNTDPKGTDQKVSNHQIYTVFSDRPGVYYCIAQNYLNQTSSEPIPVFADRSLMTILIIIFLVIMLLTLLVFFVYRHKRNKAARRRPSRNQSFLGSLAWWTGTRRSRLTNEQPFRSRDDLLPDQPCHSRQQPRRDSTPAPNINSVYCTVTHSAKAQAPSREMPIKHKAGSTQDESLNYASIHFGMKQKNKQAKGETETDVVYAMVSKKKPPKKTEQENFEDYENISKAPAAKSPNPVDDSDTSEDEVELNYTQVNFKAKPGHQRARRGSSSSEDEIEYSDVKI
ncbi:hemicentin-1 [Cheilinus undulatus]|uniref:hemicentin-1 n=1 Tax=Cheilinus undulatus TaxID=241271 RepID=UPI001BD2E418|nr:hemicentin-1 [Cheilinus undulatus]